MLAGNKWVVLIGLVALACGDDDGSTGDLPDASGSDVDANDVDSGPTSAACGIDLPDGNAGDYTVVFSGPDGELLDTVESDAEGLASYDDCVADTIVTVAFQPPTGGFSDYNLWVYAGVQPGTTVLVPQSDSPEITAEATVTLATPGPGGANGYTAYTGCREEGTDAANPGNETSLGAQVAGCGGNDQNDLDVLAVADQNGTVVGFDYGTATVDATLTEFGTLDGWEDPTTATAEVTSVPATIDSLELSVAHLRDGVRLYESSVAPAVAPGTVSDTVPALPPAGFPDTATFGAVAVFTQGGLVGLRRTTSPATTFTGDFDDFLPRLSGILLSAATPARPVAQWAADGDLSAADLGFIYFEWTDQGGGTHEVRLVVPDGAVGSVQLPALPDSLSDFRPTGDDILSPPLGLFVESADRDYTDFLTDGRLFIFLLPERVSLLFPPGEDSRSTTNITPT